MRWNMDAAQASNGAMHRRSHPRGTPGQRGRQSDTTEASAKGLGLGAVLLKRCPLPLRPATQERYLTLVRRGGRLYCVDSVCYHAGGPLGVGDIEEVNGRPCIICPWHHYKVRRPVCAEHRAPDARSLHPSQALPPGASLRTLQWGQWGALCARACSVCAGVPTPSVRPAQHRWGTRWAS